MTTTTRRGFLAAAATSGIALATGLRIRPHYDLHEMLGRWVADERYRFYDMTAPWTLEGFAFASDAKQMARISSDAADVDPAEKRIPKDTIVVWTDHWSERGQWHKLPQSFRTRNNDDGTCWKCLKRFVECRHCSGAGSWIYLPGDVEECCSHCNGDGYERDPSCDVCHGRYDRELPSVAIIGGKLIGLEYATILQEVPGCQWNANGDAESPILWRSDIGIEGMIMPRMTP